MMSLLEEYAIMIVAGLVWTIIACPATAKAFAPYQLNFTGPSTDEEIDGRVRFVRCGAYTMLALIPTIDRIVPPINILVIILAAPPLYYVFWLLYRRVEQFYAEAPPVEPPATEEQPPP